MRMRRRVALGNESPRSVPSIYSADLSVVVATWGDFVSCRPSPEGENTKDPLLSRRFTLKGCKKRSTTSKM